MNLLPSHNPFVWLTGILCQSLRESLNRLLRHDQVLVSQDCGA